VLFANIKSHTGFRLVSNSATLSDLELHPWLNSLTAVISRYITQ